MSVALCSILAMVLFLLLMRWLIPEGEREAWYWGIALMALSPLAIFLQRKIWPPSLSPLLTLAMLAGWLRRDRRAGATVLGTFGALAGQLHMASFFLTAALAGWALLFDRKSMRWPWWLLGCVLGALPAVPWLLTIYQSPELVAIKADQGWLNVVKSLVW